MNILCIAQQSSLWKLHGLYEMCLIRGLLNRGASVDYFICQGRNRLCNLGFITDREQCQRCWSRTRDLLQKMEIPWQPLYDDGTSDFFTLADSWIASLDRTHLHETVFHGYPLGKWVYSNFISVTNQPVYVPGKDPSEDILFLYLLRDACANLLTIRRILERKTYDRILLFNGRIMSGKVLWELSREQGILTYVHERGALMGTMVLARESVIPMHTLAQRCWEAWKDIPLTAEQMRQTERDIRARENHSTNVLNWTSSRTFSEDDPLLRGERGGCRRLWSVFTSSSNEFGALDQSVLGEFSSQFEWLEYVIERLLQKPDIHIALRAHPGLAPSANGIGSTVECAYFEAMRDRFRDSPRVSIFRPTDTISSYALIRESDVVLAYATTVGVEAVSKGIPAAFGCNLTYSHLKIAPLVNTRDALNAFIDHWADVENGSLPVSEQVKAWRFWYMNYHRIPSPMPLVLMPTPYTSHLVDYDLRRFLPGHTPELDDPVTRLLDGAEIYPLPTDEDAARTVSDEETFLGAYSPSVPATPHRSSVPRVSVLMHVHNGEKYLPETLDALMQQSMEDFECIVVDDASTDRTPGILAYVQKEDPRFTVLHSDGEQGVSACLNRAASHARSDLLAITGDADISLEQRLEHQLACMEADPGLGFCAGLVTGYETDTLFRRPSDSEVIRVCLLRNCPAPHSTWMVRRKLFEGLKGYSTRHVPGAEYDFLARLSLLPDVRLRILPEIHVLYRLSARTDRETFFAQQKNALYVRLFLLQQLYPDMRTDYLPVHLDFVQEPHPPIEPSLQPVRDRWGEILLEQNRRTRIYDQDVLEACVADRFSVFDRGWLEGMR